MKNWGKDFRAACRGADYQSPAPAVFAVLSGNAERIGRLCRGNSIVEIAADGRLKKGRRRPFCLFGQIKD